MRNLLFMLIGILGIYTVAFGQNAPGNILFPDNQSGCNYSGDAQAACQNAYQAKQNFINNNSWQDYTSSVAAPMTAIAAPAPQAQQTPVDISQKPQVYQTKPETGLSTDTQKKYSRGIFQ